LGVGSSNLPAPTNEINCLCAVTTSLNAKRAARQTDIAERFPRKIKCLRTPTSFLETGCQWQPLGLAGQDSENRPCSSEAQQRTLLPLTSVRATAADMGSGACLSSRGRPLRPRLLTS